MALAKSGPYSTLRLRRVPQDDSSGRLMLSNNSMNPGSRGSDLMCRSPTQAPSLAARRWLGKSRRDCGALGEQTSGSPGRSRNSHRAPSQLINPRPQTGQRWVGNDVIGTLAAEGVHKVTQPWRATVVAFGVRAGNETKTRRQVLHLLALLAAHDMYIERARCPRRVAQG
jgi:hypothetical protein